MLSSLLYWPTPHGWASGAVTGAPPPRPGIHYARPAGWMNDPVPFWDRSTGTYHLFPICSINTTTAPWWGGQQAWCHASSPDMVHWTTHSPALVYPNKTSVMGTGAVIELNPAEQKELNATTAIVTAAGWLWLSADPGLLNWREVGQLNLPPLQSQYSCEGGDVALQRMDNGAIWLVVGGSAGTSPAAFLFEGDALQLAGWRFVSPLFIGAATDGPRMECPSYFRVEGHAVLAWLLARPSPFLISPPPHLPTMTRPSPFLTRCSHGAPPTHTWSSGSLAPPSQTVPSRRVPRALPSGGSAMRQRCGRPREAGKCSTHGWWAPRLPTPHGWARSRSLDRLAYAPTER